MQDLHLLTDPGLDVRAEAVQDFNTRLTNWIILL